MILKIPEKFAKDQHLIKKICREDDTFKSIFEDYLKCIEAQEYWSRSDSDDAATRRLEYSDLLWQLEIELREIMNKSGV
jgi:hypothetical protein